MSTSLILLISKSFNVIGILSLTNAIPLVKVRTLSRISGYILQ